MDILYLSTSFVTSRDQLEFIFRDLTPLDFLGQPTQEANLDLVRLGRTALIPAISYLSFRWHGRDAWTIVYHQYNLELGYFDQLNLYELNFLETWETILRINDSIEPLIFTNSFNHFRPSQFYQQALNSGYWGDLSQMECTLVREAVFLLRSVYHNSERLSASYQLMEFQNFKYEIIDTQSHWILLKKEHNLITASDLYKDLISGQAGPAFGEIRRYMVFAYFYLIFLSFQVEHPEQGQVCRLETVIPYEEPEEELGSVDELAMERVRGA